MKKQKKYYKKIFILFILTVAATVSSAQEGSSFTEDSISERRLYNEGRNKFKQGDFAQAEKYFKESLSLIKKIYGANNFRTIQSYSNIGVQQKNQGKYDEAIQNYLIAEKLTKEIYGEDNWRLGLIYGNTGIIYKLKGDFVKSLEYQEYAIKSFQTDTIKFEEIIKSTEFNLAVSLKNLDRTDEAIEIAQKNIKGNYQILKPRYYDLLANIYTEKKELTKADFFYKKSIKSWIKNYGKDDYGLGGEYRNYADFLVKAEKYDSAEIFNTKAEEIISQTYGEKSVFFSDVQYIFGDIFFNRDSEAVTIKDFKKKKKENIEKALKFYQKAAIAVIENYNTEDPYSLPPIDNVISDMQLLTVLKKKANAFEMLAEIYQSEMDYDNYLRFNISALHTINTCTNLIHRLRIGYLTEESKLLLAEKQESTFMDAISIAYQLYKFTKEKQYLLMAYEFTEKSKSASFLASVKDMEAKEFGGIPDSLLAKEQYLKINISNYKELLFKENQLEKPDTQKTNLYSTKIFQHNEEYNQLINLFEKKYPKYYSFKYENKVINIDEIQRKLNKKEAIIEYVINEPTDTIHSGQLYRFTITKAGISLDKEDINQNYVKDIEFLHEFLSNSNYLMTRKNDYIKYCTSANDLYKTLINPVSDQIKGKHITIIPDDKLAYIPFDALLSEMPDTTKMDFRKLKYLVYDYPINYSYSSTLLFNYFETDNHISKKLAAFAPDYNPDDNNEKLLPLPGAEQEAKLLNRFNASDIYLDSAATEARFKTVAENYDILHLAMHTIVNDSLPMFSRLIFSQSGNNEQEDGQLNTHEIYNMKLNARMTVLSACNTGSGKLQKGEGVMSLARGFLYAGCPSIVMTLWEVEDLSGTEIMKNFYDFLYKGKRKDDALRLAKLKHIQNADPLKAHPHYWLGYVNIGNPEALYQSNDIYFILIIAFALIFIIIDQIIRHKKKKNQFSNRKK